MKIRMWQAIVGVGLIGLIFGIALQIGRKMHERGDARMAEEYAPWSPPLMIDLLRAEVVPIAVCVLFALPGRMVWVAWSRRQS